MESVLQKCFAEPLCDLGNDDARLRGIFTPASERGVARSGVTAQFTENAAQYHARYGNVEGLRALIAQVFGRGDSASERFILDIGSGSGNSVIPLLDLYPGAFVVATDISPQLLAILRDYLETKPAYRGRYGLVCMDANHDRYSPGAFDLAVGASILHHIVDPRRVLGACASALAPGGAALFIEPFELGHGALRVAYRRILEEAKRRREQGPGFVMIERMVVDHEARLRDKSDPIFDVLDDKWYFTRAYFEDASRGGEWSGCRVEPVNPHATMVDHARMELQLGMGLPESSLPPWAWETIREHEGSFSRDARRDLVFEGAVVLRRSAEAPPRPMGERRPGWWWNPAQAGRGFFVEFDAGTARGVCCAYAESGEPEWSVTDPGTMDLAGATAEIQVTLPSARVGLEPQNAGLPAGDRTGWWIEDARAPASSIVLEALGDRVVAALLADDGWTMVVASQRGGNTFEGEWLRYSGGQTLSGPYRAPAPSRAVGRASLAWVDEGCLVALLPDGRRRMYRRLARAEAAPQKLRSTEKCAS